MERTQKARAALERLQKEKAERSKTHAKAEAKKPEPRVSLTDLECRCMRFADGAVRPAYNAQIAAAPRQGVIVAVSVTDRRNDSGLAVPMVEEVANRYGEAPKTLLADTHYATKKILWRFHNVRPERSKSLCHPSRKTHVKPETLARRERARAREAEPLRRWRQHMESEKEAEISPAQFDRTAECRRQEPRLRPIASARPHQSQNHPAMVRARNNLMAAHRLRMAPADTMPAAPASSNTPNSQAAVRKLSLAELLKANSFTGSVRGNDTLFSHRPNDTLGSGKRPKLYGFETSVA